MVEWWLYTEVKLLKKHNIGLVAEVSKNLQEKKTLMCPCNEPTASRGSALKPQIDSRGDGSDKVDSLRLRQSQHFSICRPELTDLYNETGTRLLLHSSLLLQSFFISLPCASSFLWSQKCHQCFLCCNSVTSSARHSNCSKITWQVFVIVLFSISAIIISWSRLNIHLSTTTCSNSSSTANYQIFYLFKWLSVTVTLH